MMAFDEGPSLEDTQREPARIVREALFDLARDERTDPDAAHYLAGFARTASNYTLVRLGRLLK